MILTLIFALLIQSSFASGPCGGAQVGFWTNPDGSRGGSVASTAKVRAGAFIATGAQVCESAQVKSGAKILDQVIVSGRAVINSGAEISGRAKVQGEAKIGGSNVATKIGGDALVEGSAMVTGNTQVIARAKVRGSSKVHNSIVCQASLIEGFDVMDSDYYCQTEDPEPQHPGELGMKTLLGVDSDRDGVRDDVEIWINDTYSNTPQKNFYEVREVMKASAILKQQRLKNSKNKEKVLQGISVEDATTECMSMIVDNQDDGISHGKRLRVQMFNTKERLLAYLQSEKFLPTEMYQTRTDKKAVCSLNARLKKLFK